MEKILLGGRRDQRRSCCSSVCVDRRSSAPRAVVKPALAKGTPSASVRLRNGSLNAVRLRSVFDLFDRNGDGEITVDALGLDADRTGLAATVGAYVPDGAAGLRFEDFDNGDAFFGALVDQQDEAADGAAVHARREAQGRAGPRRRQAEGHRLLRHADRHRRGLRLWMVSVVDVVASPPYKCSIE
ncbi:unnamed protein product [Miscanthus lutarioriparius]|uniref:EF-hand domain-containing protein n=1 Tax=Miscanthus lutarioriparius TaxID=422564 RepID=A0A811QHU3_9POAL|nr:unnamed protein product [Miscanthus lutarioriparius]